MRRTSDLLGVDVSGPLLSVPWLLLSHMLHSSRGDATMTRRVKALLSWLALLGDENGEIAGGLYRIALTNLYNGSL